MDIVYVYRTPPDGNTAELRCSLRSLANVADVGTVWIVGDRPDWLTNVRHIPTVQDGTKYSNSTGNIRAACEHPDMPETFAWFNDDFFAMRPVAIETMHRGPLADVIRHYRVHAGGSPYTRGMIETQRLLEAQGCDTPLSYELHLPILVDREPLLKAIALRDTVELAHTRTLYGNLAGIGGRQVEDVKVHDAKQAGWTWWPWLSTTNDTFRRGKVGEHIRANLDTPSPHEADQ